MYIDCGTCVAPVTTGKRASPQRPLSFFGRVCCAEQYVALAHRRRSPQYLALFQFRVRLKTRVQTPRPCEAFLKNNFVIDKIGSRKNVPFDVYKSKRGLRHDSTPNDERQSRANDCVHTALHTPWQPVHNLKRRIIARGYPSRQPDPSETSRLES